MDHVVEVERLQLNFLITSQPSWSQIHVYIYTWVFQMVFGSSHTVLTPMADDQEEEEEAARVREFEANPLQICCWLFLNAKKGAMTTKICGYLLCITWRLLPCRL